MPTWCIQCIRQRKEVPPAAPKEAPKLAKVAKPIPPWVTRPWTRPVNLQWGWAGPIVPRPLHTNSPLMKNPAKNDDYSLDFLDSIPGGNESSVDQNNGKSTNPENDDLMKLLENT